jgi:hypothetical protein
MVGSSASGALFFDDLGNGLPVDRLDVGRIRHGRVGHDGRRVGVHQNDTVTLFTQRLARLGSGVVEFAGLSDHDRARTKNENTVYVRTFWHLS